MTKLRGLMERLWAEAADSYHAKLLASLPRGPALRLLDVGCDDGEWTDRARSHMGIPATQVKGIEVVPERAALASARGFEVWVGDLDSTWPVEDASIDVVHANQVIEHVARLDHFISEIRRVLVAGGLAVVCTENLASWHNIGALMLGWQPFSTTNVSSLRPIGNRFALHADEVPEKGDSWQHTHVLALTGLTDLFTAHGFDVRRTFAAGYHPAFGRLARALERVDPRHAHFIGVVARAPRQRHEGAANPRATRSSTITSPGD
jgi:SAM-dependent methyltransferase